MTLEQEYLRLALRLFPHERGRMEGPGNYVPACYSRDYALDHDPVNDVFRVRCQNCHQMLNLPKLEVNWKTVWKGVFHHGQNQVDFDGLRLGAGPARAAGNGQ